MHKIIELAPCIPTDLLNLGADIARAVLASTRALLLLGARTLEVVVEGHLATSGDEARGEQPHTDLRPDLVRKNNTIKKKIKSNL